MVLGDPTLDKESDFAPLLVTDIGTACFVRRFGLPKISLLPITAAPEHLKKQFVPAGDQYSLATLLYFWLAGRPPFLGTSNMLMQQKLTETITPLTSLNPSVTAQQEEIVHRALSSTPEKRYPSILVFAEALADSLQEPAYTTLSDEATPQLSHESAITSRLAAPTPTNQQTDELPPIEREIQLISPNDQDEDLTIQEKNHTQEETETSPAFEALLSSLLRDIPPLSFDYNMHDSDSLLNTEPTLHDGLVTEPGSQRYQPLMLDTETNILWDSIILQAQKSAPPPQIEPDIPQPLPQPEKTPEPQPGPEQRPTPPPQPEPVTPLPQPAPDIAQPLPEPSPTPPEEPTVPSDPVQPSPDKQQTQEAQKIVPRLIITSHYQAEPREVPLEQEIITLGRAGSSDILLDYDNLTSRHHALLKYDRNQYVIFDQRSAKGVYVNGQKLTVGVGWRSGPFRLLKGPCRGLLIF